MKRDYQKIILNAIPEAWERDFESFDGPDKTTIREVQEVLLKIERCEDLEAKHNAKKEDRQKGKKRTKEGDEKGKKKSKNPCRIEGHDHDWKDCPDNWNNKKEKEKKKKQENNNIEMRKMEVEKEIDESLNDSSSEEDSDDESVLSHESYCVISKKSDEEKQLGGEVLISLIKKGVRKNYTCLLDTGTSESLLSEKLADEKAVVTSKEKIEWETQAGNFSTQKRVTVKECKLPQFTTHRKFDGLFHLFKKSKNDKYDVIIERDLLKKIDIDLLYSTEHIRWGDISVPMVLMGHFSKNKSRRKLFRHADQLEKGGQEMFVSEILESKYKMANLEEVANLREK